MEKTEGNEGQKSASAKSALEHPRALRVEISQPLNMTWDVLGAILMTHRKIVPQLLRAGMDARVACGVVGSATAKHHLAPAARGNSSGTMVYQSMLSELDKIKKGKWSKEARPHLDVCGGMVSALSQRVTQLYGKRANFNGKQPIPVRKQETKIERRVVTLRDKEGNTFEADRFVLNVKLVSDGRVQLALKRSKGSHWSILRKIAEGTIAHGDCRLIYDPRKKKWYAFIAYDKPAAAPMTVDPARALIVHRGVNNALTMIATTGGSPMYESGAKLLGQIRGLDARMRKKQRVSNATLGSGARGHGVERRFERYNSLRNKRKRVVHTWCQQMAALVCKTARRNGCALIVIEDYGGIEPHEEKTLRRVLVRFPLYQLKQAIVHRAEIEGMTVSEVKSNYISSTCLACGNEDEAQHNTHTNVFHCAACDFERPADFLAAIHMMRRADVDSSVWDERISVTQRLVAAGKAIEEGSA